MAIDKIIPKGFDSDTDERLIAKGMMPDSTNISTSEGGSGTSGLVKNIKGTISGSPFSDADKLPVDQRKSVGYYTIGQVSDDQRGFIYYAVVSTDSINCIIYRYDVSDE